MRMSAVSIEELVEKLSELNPDIMQLDDKDAFERGKDAGKVELIQYIKITYLENEDENYR